MKDKKQNLIIYQAKSGEIRFRGDFSRDTIWATQKQIAEVFDVNPQAITKHIKNIYNDGELKENQTCSILEQVQKEGSKMVKRKINFYNLDQREIDEYLVFIFPKASVTIGEVSVIKSVKVFINELLLFGFSRIYISSF